MRNLRLDPFPALLPNLALQGTTLPFGWVPRVSSRLKHVAPPACGYPAYFVAPNASGTLKNEIPREVRETGLEMLGKIFRFQGGDSRSYRSIGREPGSDNSTVFDRDMSKNLRPVLGTSFGE